MNAQAAKPTPEGLKRVESYIKFDRLDIDTSTGMACAYSKGVKVATLTADRYALGDLICLDSIKGKLPCKLVEF